MLKRILLRIANEIAYNTGEVTGVITLIVWFLYTRDRVLHDKSPAAFIIFFSIILYLPLFSAIFYILMLIPKLVCMTILLVIDKKNRYGHDSAKSNGKEFEGFWKEQNQAYDDIERERKERERQNEQAWQNSYESWKRTYERYHSQQEKNYQRTYNKNRQQDNTDYGRQQNNGTAGYKKDELHDALSFYGLSIPFTQDQLREKRRKLMKAAHPDEGGNTEAAADINRYFDILKKYAN